MATPGSNVKTYPYTPVPPNLAPEERTLWERNNCAGNGAGE